MSSIQNSERDALHNKSGGFKDEKFCCVGFIILEERHIYMNTHNIRNNQNFVCEEST